MMLLNDREIVRCLGDRITPFSEGKIRCTHNGRPAVSYGTGHYGYDLSLGQTARQQRHDLAGVAGVVYDVKAPRPDIWADVELHEGDSGPFFVVMPGTLILGVSVEYIRMPPDVLGIAVGKSTYARAGLIANVTPLEPGWEGHLTIEISNTGIYPVRVYAMEGIVQILFVRGERPQSLYTGAYQQQSSVPTPSQVGEG